MTPTQLEAISKALSVLCLIERGLAGGKIKGPPLMGWDEDSTQATVVPLEDYVREAVQTLGKTFQELKAAHAET